MVEQSESTESSVPSSSNGAEKASQGMVFVANCENKEQASHVISFVKEHAKGGCDICDFFQDVTRSLTFINYSRCH